MRRINSVSRRNVFHWDAGKLAGEDAGPALTVVTAPAPQVTSVATDKLVRTERPPPARTVLKTTPHAMTRRGITGQTGTTM